MSSRVDEQLKDPRMAEHNMVTAGNGSTSREDKAGDGHDASEEVLKNLLRDEEAFKKELTKRRIHRGKIRGKIRVLQESMELLIIPEGQETTEELQSLEVQEDLLHDQLRRAEEYIEELQQCRAEVVSKTAKNRLVQ
ncbi:hypothetical protein Pmar_PMAR025444 [Perkinsus marinus ATCC 50983]|uniref:Uncharacterized protein n=1 Tax=Perkinsus marinus (strain ATCC 50983 / TXsc) TaxID=423536 RepID=C5LR89_PERM5|nr:hypothetical protein Pmar_PMAR025444 [Perkinsus marinus ATCC 50983]EER00754.1 hypothetical protein Pmar_PMAR025444 [Perkinsus marinus ATCC 50983]|eukprot:XP_002768036.1 hypothetical protein Pmar_PMAR025444 [Perkinsus marinus ATCC 50983]